MTSKRYYIILASLLFGFLMWASVTLSDEYHISLDIPLVPKNVPESRVLTGFVPKTVSIRLKGNGWRMVSMLLSSTPQCVLNVASFGTSPAVVTKANLINNVAGIPGLQVVDLDLDTLVFGLDWYSERSIRVRPNVIIDCPDGYAVVGDVQVRPESVAVGGAESLLKDINLWETENKRFSNVREPLTADVGLREPDTYSLSVHPKQVKIYVDVQQFAEKTLLGVTIETVAVPSNREIIFIPPKVNLIVRGGIQQLATLSAGDFRLSVNYEHLLTDTTGFVRPAIQSPAGIRVLAQRPERLQYIIRKRL